jgi:hypothetical protein
VTEISIVSVISLWIAHFRNAREVAPHPFTACRKTSVLSGNARQSPLDPGPQSKAPERSAATPHFYAPKFSSANSQLISLSSRAFTWSTRRF